MFELLNNLSRPARCRVTCREVFAASCRKVMKNREKKSGSHGYEINTIEFPFTKNKDENMRSKLNYRLTKNTGCGFSRSKICNLILVAKSFFCSNKKAFNYVSLILS